MALGVCAHAYGTYFMGERDRWFDRMRARFRLEHGLALGGLITLAGLVVGAVIVADWIRHGLGQLSMEHLAVLARRRLIIVGIQIFFSSFLLSILRVASSGHVGPAGRAPCPSRRVFPTATTADAGPGLRTAWDRFGAGPRLPTRMPLAHMYGNA